MRNHNIQNLTTAAMIAAIYVVLTLISQSLGLASGVVQVRLSEALCVLPAFSFAAVPGVAIGCLLANIITGCALQDVIFGTLATLIGAVLTRALRNNKYLAVIPPIAANTIIIPLVLYYFYTVQDASNINGWPLWAYFISVFIGEFISAGVLGMVVYNVVSKYREQLFPHST